MKYRNSLFLFAFLSVGSQSSHAEFSVAGMEPSPVQPERSVVTFSNEDKQPSVIALSKGQSNEQRLALSLKKLVPKGWKTKIEHNGEVNSSCKISWTGGDEWTKTLEQSLLGTGLAANVDWAKRRITLSPYSQGSCVESTLAAPVVTSSACQRASGDWSICSGARLSEGLSSSAQRNGWSVQWSVPYDFIVERDIPLTGDVTTMMRTVVLAYKAIGEMQDVVPVVNDISKVVEFKVLPVDSASLSAPSSTSLQGVLYEGQLPWVSNKRFEVVTAKSIETPVFTLKSGPSLKNELSEYAETQGWTLRWDIDHDYRVDVPIPLRGDFYASIIDLIKSYQALGGMIDVVPRFLTSNKVLSIEIIDQSTRQK